MKISGSDCAGTLAGAAVDYFANARAQEWINAHLTGFPYTPPVREEGLAHPIPDHPTPDKLINLLG